MKDLLKVFDTRPALIVGFLMISIGMLLTSTTTFANDADNELLLESWMTIPFDYDSQESEMNVELWMAVPFNSEVQETDMNLESWMVLPFTTEYGEEEVSTEDWMTSPWI